MGEDDDLGNNFDNQAAQTPPTNQNNSPPPSLVISHALSGQLGLNNVNREGLVNFSQYFNNEMVALPLAAALISLAGYQFKTQENIAALQANVAAVQEDVTKLSENSEKSISVSDSQRADLLAAAKYVLLDPIRVNYSNDNIVRDLMNFLKKNSKNNSFTAYFENESTSFRGVVLAKARKQATYAKRILKETWVSTTLDIFTAVGTTLATETVANAMIGNSDTVGVQQISRMLLVRAFLRERQERLSRLSKPKQLTSKAKKSKGGTNNKRKRTSDNFDSAPNGLPDENEDMEEEGDEMKAFWADFSAWLQVKIDGKKVTGPDGKETMIPGWGKTFKTKDWSKYYEELVADELKLFPEDTIPLIPRQTLPQLQPGEPELSATFSTPAPSPYVRQFGSNGIGTPQMSSGSRLHTTLGTPMGFRSDSPIGSLFTTAGGSQSNQLGMSYAHQSFMIPASQSQTRFEPQETNGTSQDSSNQWTGQVQTRAPAGLQALLQNGFQGPN